MANVLLRTYLWPVLYILLFIVFFKNKMKPLHVLHSQPCLRLLYQCETGKLSVTDINDGL
jgi:hypothetical protein